MNKLFVSWQNPKSREWKPVGVFEHMNDKYMFHYTSGALDEMFPKFDHMLSLTSTYVAEGLLPFLKNRTMPKSRPDYSAFMDWLNLSEEEASPLMALARSGGLRATDNLQFFAKPEPQDGKYIVDFFVHGIRHLPKETQKAIEDLEAGAKLFPMLDVNNDYDIDAVALRTDDPVLMVGYVPRPYANDFKRLIDNGEAEVVITKVNTDAPGKFKLLCQMKASWPNNFSPFGEEYFQSIEINSDEREAV